jgi:hypothetical protein
LELLCLNQEVLNDWIGGRIAECAEFRESAKQQLAGKGFLFRQRKAHIRRIAAIPGGTP